MSMNQERKRDAEKRRRKNQTLARTKHVFFFWSAKAFFLFALDCAALSCHDYDDDDCVGRFTA